MRKSFLKCFGVGDGWPCSDRNHAAFLYQFGRASILIDCGEPIDGSFKRAGLNYESPDAIFISHLHADHFGGFFMLAQGMWLEGRKRELPVYLPGGGIRPLNGMLKAAFLSDDAIPLRLRLRPHLAGKPTRVRGVRITPFRTSHMDDLKAKARRKRQGDLSAYCFLLES